MPRRPGPQPKPEEQRRRRNADTVTGGAPATTIPADRVDDPAPDLPSWCTPRDGRTLRFYRDLCTLPQRRLWGEGDWLAIWATLPLIDKYFERPGSEAYKAWTSALFPALRITSDDLVKARVRLDDGTDDQEAPAAVAIMDQYRAAVGDGGA